MQTEKDLFEAIKQQDQKALEQLYHLYFPRLSRFIAQVMQDSNDVVDVINEVFLVVWNDAEKFRGDSSLSSWIMGIAYNKVLSTARKKKHWLSFSDDLSGFEAINDNMIQAEPSSDIEDVRKVMKSLSPEQRAMTELTYFFGYSYQEVSEILKCKTSFVRHQLYEARQLIKQRMETGNNS